MLRVENYWGAFSDYNIVKDVSVVDFNLMRDVVLAALLFPDNGAAYFFQVVGDSLSDAELFKQNKLPLKIIQSFVQAGFEVPVATVSKAEWQGNPVVLSQDNSIAYFVPDITSNGYSKTQIQEPVLPQLISPGNKKYIFSD